jgi:Leucine rich repeat variant
MARAGVEDRIRTASDPACGRFMLWLLLVRGWFSRALLRELAANPRVPRALLWCLSIRRWDVRVAVAANPRCPRPLLRPMARSHDWAVRAALTSRHTLPPALLAGLIRRSAPCVRLYAAASPSLPHLDTAPDRRQPFLPG